MTKSERIGLMLMFVLGVLAGRASVRWLLIDFATVVFGLSNFGGRVLSWPWTFLLGPRTAEPRRHRCSGCGLRWEGELPGAELCGDCWRKAQPVLHE